MLFRYATLILLPLFGMMPWGHGSEVRYAQNFDIAEFDDHRILTVRNAFRHSEKVYRYALVPKGQALPKLPAGTQVIRTPVERVVAMETVYIGHMEALGQLDRIVAAATVNFISNRT
ncbi:MAG TPA: hypothetical protein VJ952_05175, partial [Opitutales bacterium]|nr:hypothetical protein [Opitutales bacterium]